MWRLATQRAPITIMPVASALLRIERPQHYRQLALLLKVGDEIPLEDLIAHLESIGYERREPVEMVGEYSVRGGILDVFSPEADKPVRIDLFGDQVESIRRFDVESQRSVLKVEDCLLLPLTEYQKSRPAAGGTGGEAARSRHAGARSAGRRRDLSGWELVAAAGAQARRHRCSLLRPADGGVGRAGAVRAAAERLWKRLEQTERHRSRPAGANFPGLGRSRGDGGCRAAGAEGTGDLGSSRRTGFTSRPGPRWPSTATCRWPSRRPARWWKRGNRVAFFASSTGEVERVADILNEYGMPYQLGLEQFDSTPAYLAGAGLHGRRSAASIYLVKGRIAHGTVFPDSKLVVIWLGRSVRDVRDGGAGAGPKSALAHFPPI